jgi:hypothetical protein
MGMSTKIIAGIFLLLASWQTFACDMHGITGIVAENDLYIPVGAKSTGGITEAQFNETLDRVEEIYRPIIQAKGKNLVVNRKWTDGTVNAYAQQSGNNWMISMFGGLARHQTISQDAFAVVACHELGHHIGGLPKKRSWWGTSWASNEGQSDYFATSKCLRKYMENDDNHSIVGKLNVPQVVTDKCQAQFGNQEEIDMCVRGAMAGLSLANLFRALRNQTKELKHDTPDPKVVTATDDNHPASQCRLDTYFNGALCDKGAYDDVSDTDFNQGTCNRAERAVEGLRPLCWYKPAANL